MRVNGFPQLSVDINWGKGKTIVMTMQKQCDSSDSGSSKGLTGDGTICTRTELLTVFCCNFLTHTHKFTNFPAKKVEILTE